MKTGRLEAARRRGFVEGLRDAADEAGSWGPSAAHIAMHLRAKADRLSNPQGTEGAVQTLLGREISSMALSDPPPSVTNERKYQIWLHGGERT